MKKRCQRALAVGFALILVVGVGLGLAHHHHGLPSADASCAVCAVHQTFAPAPPPAALPAAAHGVSPVTVTLPARPAPRGDVLALAPKTSPPA